MSAITPEFMTDLETRMRSIVVDEYNRLNKRTWWQLVARRTESVSRRERLVWLLSTAKIERPNAKHGGGQAIFEDLVAQYTEFEAENASAGLELKKEQLEDVFNGVPGGEGMALAARWSKDVTSYAVYWPQQEVANVIKANPKAYDGKNFFASDHPVNPFDTAAGTFANHFTGSANGIYPGALPIGGTTTIDAAVANIAKAIAYVASIKMPNGTTPRNLRLGGILVPPALEARAQQITNAKFIAQASQAGGALSGDIEAVVRNFGLGQPVVCTELGAAFGGSDSDYYLAVEGVTDDELGALTYVEREPFSILYHDGMSSAELARKRTFQWTTEGRNVVAPGHPFLLFKCSAT